MPCSQALQMEIVQWSMYISDDRAAQSNGQAKPLDRNIIGVKRLAAEIWSTRHAR